MSNIPSFLTTSCNAGQGIVTFWRIVVGEESLPLPSATKETDGLRAVVLRRPKVCRMPGVVNRTQSNLISIELNRTQSNLIGGLSSIEFDNRMKSNSPKSKKINRTQSNVRVTQARQMQNDTCDDNGRVTVTSTVSLNLHKEELREVPENSISSLFFHKSNALSSSSGTLLRARDKITLDTQELNVHEHLIIYFDFDLKRKIILLLHLLFLLSIMAVRCSQTSNILTLVHLLLSCSLLIVHDEFERIMYIVSKIFFIIIHLLNAVACVAVSNLHVLLHKSNPSSCLGAIVS